jgi:hypothetical protein
MKFGANVKSAVRCGMLGISVGNVESVRNNCTIKIATKEGAKRAIAPFAPSFVLYHFTDVSKMVYI